MASVFTSLQILLALVAQDAPAHERPPIFPGTSTLAATATTAPSEELTPRDLIDVDPDLVSRCTVQGGRARFTLEGLDWSGWQDFCEKLAGYLRLDSRPAATPSHDEKLILETGFFVAASCHRDGEGALACAMTPRPIVRDVKIVGSLPFVLLQEDVRRRVFLRPGTVMQRPSVLEDQQRRLETYLQRQGFFRSDVKVVPEPGRSGAQPNQAIELDFHVDTGQTLNLGEVRVLGDPGVPREEIEDRVRHYWIFSIFPRRFTPEQLDEDVDGITKMLIKNGWPEASVKGLPTLDFERDYVRLDLTVDLRAKLELKFTGNEALDDGDLEDLVTFRDAASMDSVEVERSAEAIREEYQRKGYYEARVDTAVEDETEPARRAVTFSIEEGPRAEIARVEVRGNHIFTASEIMSGADVKTHAGRLFSRGRWIDSRVTRDVRAIVRYYRLHGFSDADVRALREELPDGNLAAIFEIKEGPRRTVGALKIEGLPSDVPKDEIERKLKLTPGQPFIEELLDADRREILTALAAHGYALAEVHRRLRAPYRTEGGEATLDYTVVPNVRSIYGGFLLRGAFRTHQGVIADELGLDPGEPLDLLALSQATQRLRALGVFGSVDLAPIGTSLSTPETWVLLNVTESTHPTFDLVFSFSTADLFRIGADFRDANFVGRAIYLDLSARLSNASQVITDARIGRRDRLVAELRAPHPLGFPFNGDYSAYYDYEDQVRRKAQEDGTTLLEGFTRRRVGITLGLSRQLVRREDCAPCPDVVARLGYELASTEGVNYGGVLSGMLENTPNSTIGRLVPSFSVRRVDSPVDPRSGYGSSLRFEVAHDALAGLLRGGASFWRLLASMELYWKLGTPFREELSDSVIFGGPFVLASGTSYGVGHPWAGSHELPITETFDYGGDLTVRGISERASLRSVEAATYLLTSTLELRYYFLTTSFGAFQLAAIGDLGMVSRHLDRLVTDPTLTAGGAFRFVTPVGPLSLAYARPVRLAEGIESKGRVHFSFGYSF